MNLLPVATAIVEQESWASAQLALIFGSLGIFLVLTRLPRLQGTTLVAPARWIMLSLLVVSFTETAIGWLAPPSASTWRYLASISTLCPTMAVLGAKRPQDRGWQFIVASLWLVLALPAAQDLAFAGGTVFSLHPTWEWFLLLLIAIGCSNQLPTRFGIATLLVTAAQIVLLGGQLPFLQSWNWQRWHWLALPMITGAIALAWLQTRKQRTASGWDQVWTDFRDQFGTVWALRVMERMNHATRMHDWKARLSWRGFLATEHSGETPNPTQQKLDKEMEVSFRTLLRRFVSPAWIDSRLADNQSTNSEC
ncbi:MAG: hypothetical protein P8N76_26810 [Pirellulaceae bacterium]|nr:hypothetical protein [Pirellulaceae bacterium]